MSASADLPAVIASRYVPIRLIAKGGMGAVYEVEHARTGERLALKLLHAGVGASTETQERFKREARASARLKSEHVVRVTDADVAPELGGAPFLVMELLEGTDLERAAPGPTPATVVDWLRQVATVLDRAHALGIVHRDLKPENLFLCRRPELPPIVKVLDFGIIKMAEEKTAASQAGRILGTPQYMAPEQLSADGQITGAADRYALGLVAYRLLTGELWYRGDVMTVLAQILHQPLGTPSERNPALGAGFDGWFARACHRMPEARFASAEEQIEALAAVLGLPTIALPAARSAPPVSPVALLATASAAPVTMPRRRRAVTFGVALGVLAAGGAALLVSRSPGRASSPPRPAVVVTAPTPPAPAAAVMAPAAAPAAPPAPPVRVVAAPNPSPPVPIEPARVARPRRMGPPRQAAAPPPPPATDPYADQK